MFYCKKNIYLK